MNATPDLRTRDDRLKAELKNFIAEYLFDELSAGFVQRSGMEFMEGVPVPLSPRDMVAAKEGTGLDVSALTDNMAVVMGADPSFRHVGAYLRFMARCFDSSLVDVMTSKAGGLLGKEQFRKACVYFRTALILDNGDRKAIFGYACACRQWYLSLEGDDGVEELVSVLKSESKEYFEYCTALFPKFADAHYFLGYVYLNEGAYQKASIIWKRYLAMADPEKNEEEINEIKERVDSLKDPVAIETGINELMAGRLEEGLRILEPYTESSFNTWWPLHYYLGCAYRELGHPEEAMEGFRKALALSPSNVECCEALAQVCAEVGDTAGYDKYHNKAELLRRDE